ncbi:Retinol dehydrogenase 14 [Blomia tropicalis]|nr:Retinol dehydrogenase 14 [Blomia tropicalis]
MDFAEGIRYYNSRFVWGNYEMMIDKSETKKNRLEGKTFIVTGANSGIGKEVAQELYRNGAHVILACRNERETIALIEQLRSNYCDCNGQLTYKHLDLANFESIQKFVDEIKNEQLNIHTLINNAAIFGGPIELTKDEYELNIQVNHLGPALLTILLLPIMTKHEPFLNTDNLMHKKVIMVTSTLAKNGTINEQLLNRIDDSKIIELRRLNQSNKDIYMSSKLANLLFTRHLSKLITNNLNLDICLASPGFTLTRLHRYVTIPKRFLLALYAPLFAMILRSPKQGAQTVIGCAMSQQVQSDVLYQNCRANDKLLSSGIVNDQQASERVYRLTMSTLNKCLELPIDKH